MVKNADYVYKNISCPVYDKSCMYTDAKQINNVQIFHIVFLSI